MSQSQEAPWIPIARRKQAERAGRIPSKWSLPPNVIPRDPPKLQHGPQNVLDVPRQFLSQLEISITESYTISTLVEAIASKELSAAQVAEAFCHRAAIAHQLTNCLTEPLFDTALERARYLDTYLQENGKAIGPLHGVPVSVKDTFNIAGVDSSMGLAYLCHKPVAQNAPLVDLLLSLGCVIIAKTNIPQTLASLDSINNVFGRTMNPINRMTTAGGSSGGEGVLVAMKGSMIGFGTDIGGSIRIPAMCNGVYGFKPSNGRVPYGGQVSPAIEGISRASVQAVAGPIGRSVDDINIVMREILPRAALWGEDCIPSAGYPPSKSARPTGSGKNGDLVIGVLRSDGNCSIHPPIEKMLDEVASALSRAPNTTVIELETPKAWTKTQSVMNKLLGVDGSTILTDMIESMGEPLVPWIAARFKKGSPLPLPRLADLQAQRTKLEHEMLNIWIEADEHGRRRQKLDAIICPVAPHPVPPIDGYNAVGMTSSWVMLDYPAGALPVRNIKESDLQLGIPQGGQPLSNWDNVNRDLWDESKIDRRVYLGTSLSVQVVVPRLQDEKLIEVMSWVDGAVKLDRDGTKVKL